jgi:chorismate synthase
VEIGLGVESARRKGSDVHDEIDPDERNAKAGGVRRRTNRAGGMEGGVTNGEQIIVRAAMKPISTLMRPLGTIEMKTREPAQAVAERSDVTAVPAMGVIAEAMTAFVVAQAVLEKFGGDSIGETRRNYDNYIQLLSGRKGR